MSKISERIQNIKDQNKIGLMGHVIAGYPDIQSSYEAALGICEGGADLLEIQFPFSDPTADGPTIEAACYDSIKRGFTVDKGFELVKKIASETTALVLIMTYANIIYKYGIERFISKAKDSGVQGLIIPDIPIDSDEGLNDLCKKNNIDNILIAAPGASIERIKKLNKSGSGFIYTVIRRGITGKKTEINEEAFEWISTVRENSFLPIAVGFGIQSNEQIKELINKCNIIVVGSHFVRKINRFFYDKKDLKSGMMNETKELMKF